MKLIVKKILTLIITLLCISFLSFAAFTLIPGDAALTKLGVDATEEQVEAMRKEMGLDRSLPERYFSWLGKALQGDFGESLKNSGTSVRELLASRLPITLTLAALSLILILALSLPLALICVRYEGSPADRLLTGLGVVTMAVPAFFLGILVTFFFGLVLRWFRPGSEVDLIQNFWGSIYYLLYPAAAVALPKVAMTVRFLKTSLLGEMEKDYVRTARAKGNGEDRVLYGHVLRNSLIPVVTFAALVAAEILSGSIVAEQVFSLNGLGRLMITSIGSRDYPVVQAIVLYITTVVVSLNTLVDILYILIDPRTRVK
ncbi:MAG: ABC transporter permease [Lachnospiraceae bacterium]|nr:ABC transporter permease [Lachnospiraceae bacterium]